MKSLLARVAWLFLGSSALMAQSLVVSLVPPGQAVAPGAALKLDLMAVNPSTADAVFAAPAVLHGMLFVGQRSWPVELQSEPTMPRAVASGQFAYRGYGLVLPPAATGRVVLEIADSGFDPLRTVIMVSADDARARPAKTVAPLSTLQAATPAMTQIQRSFIGHFSPHDPIYFIYGDKAPGAKFQFSFKYRLLDFQRDIGRVAARSLQFGYTQRSLWDIAGDSSPFYDTSYMPSLFYESLAPVAENGSSAVTWVGYQTGYQHESNGQNGTDSRSLNTLFFRSGLIVGPLHNWRLVVAPRVWAYVGDVSNNRNIRDYRGYGEWLVVLGKNDGLSLSYTGRSGQHLNHFTTQLDLTIPVRTKLLDFATYFLIQYFDGYGESLRGYDKKSDALRAGVSLVR